MLLSLPFLLGYFPQLGFHTEGMQRLQESVRVSYMICPPQLGAVFRSQRLAEEPTCTPPKSQQHVMRNWLENC